MQVFVPYPDVRRSLESLDDRRLRNQRNEALVQLKTLMGEYERGWPHHPSVKAFRRSPVFLAYYGAIAALVCYERGIRTRHADPTPFIERIERLVEQGHSFRYPSWWGCPEVHESHKANLVRKGEHYRAQWPDVQPREGYVWRED